MYKSATIPTSDCSYPVGMGKDRLPCGSRASLTFVRTTEGGKPKRFWAWWCTHHEDFYRKYLAFVAK